MAALYVVVSWLIIQVAGELIDLAHLPDWVGPAVLGVLTIGFPIALVLSWFYEIRPEGLGSGAIGWSERPQARFRRDRLVGRRCDDVRL